MRAVLVLLLNFTVLCAISQVPLDYRTEQIYLAPRSIVCQPGTSLGVDGIVTCRANDRLEPYSRYLYLELIDGKDSVHVRQKLSCSDNGRFSTSVLIDPDLPSGIYYLRGYTRFMRNFSNSAFAFQPIAVGVDIPDRIIGDTAQCKVSANGGFLLAGIPQRITAVLTDETGIPIVDRQALLTNDTGDTVLTRKTSPSGYVSFDFIPQKGEKYEVRFPDSLKTVRYSAPEVRERGVKLKTAISGKKLRFEIEGEINDTTYRLLTFDRNNGILELCISGRSGSFVFENQPEGPVSLFMVDSANTVLSENTVTPFIRKNIVIDADREVTAGSNYSYKLPDVAGKKNAIIARIIPDNVLWSEMADEALVYTADYESSLPFPRAWENRDDYYSDLTAWFENSRFSRFELKDVLENDSLNYGFFPEFVMGFIGKVFEDEKCKKIISRGQVLAMEQSTGTFYMTPIMDNGQFGLIVDNFEEGETYSLHTLDEKGKNVEAMIIVEDDTFPSVEIRKELRELGVTKTMSADSMYMDNSKFLPEVTVKARMSYKDKKAGKAHYETKMKDRETIERRGYITLLDILNDMPLITVKKVENENGSSVWRIYGSRGASILKAGEDRGLALVIDGVKMDPETFDVWLQTPALNIESVEQVSIGEALMLASNAFDGAIAVKTRKYAPVKPQKSKGTEIKPFGLSDVKLNNFKKLQAPVKEGRYRLIVDVIGPDGVVSRSKIFNVKKADK